MEEEEEVDEEEEQDLLKEEEEEGVRFLGRLPWNGVNSFDP